MHDNSHNLFLTLAVTTLLVVPPGCSGQGRLQMPLGRSSLWRVGVDTPENYDDHMLECGGQWYKQKRGDMCGLCGDPVDKPRENEAGGKYDTGLLSASFSPGQRTQFKVLMMSNHGGYFEFKVCPNKPASQACFDSNPVQMADGSGTRWYLPKAVQGVMTVDVTVPSMTCQNCVMQLTYTGSTAWGTDWDGTECEGCGPQYQLRNCADIAIMPGGQAPVDPAIQKYNDAENGGRNPVGTYWFDPWASPQNNFPDMNSPQSGSPFGQDPWVNPSLPRRPMGNDQGDPWINQATPTRAPRGPMGNNQADPWTNPPGNRSPFARDPWVNQAVPTPAPRRVQPDPWTNPPMNRSPQGSRMTGNNQRDPWPNTQRVTPAPRMTGNNPFDPWTNPPRSVPRATPAPRMTGNNPADPWTNPPRSDPRATPAPRMTGNNPFDPWTNPPRSVPRATPAPRMTGNNPFDPWTNPPGNNQGDLIPYAPIPTPAPRRTGNNQGDPWPNAQRANPSQRMTGNNQRDPWPNTQQQRMTGNNQRDPWPNNQRMTGNNQRTNPSQRMTGNNQRDPWPNTQRMTGNNQADPWQHSGQTNRDPWVGPQAQNPPRSGSTMNNNRPDPWQRNSGSSMSQRDAPLAGAYEDPTVIYTVEVQSRDVEIAPQLACVAIGEKAGDEGMDQWCTDNCNLNYCPQVICSC